MGSMPFGEAGVSSRSGSVAIGGRGALALLPSSGPTPEAPSCSRCSACWGPGSTGARGSRPAGGWSRRKLASLSLSLSLSFAQVGSKVEMKCFLSDGIPRGASLVLGRCQDDCAVDTDIHSISCYSRILLCYAIIRDMHRQLTLIVNC